MFTKKIKELVLKKIKEAFRRVKLVIEKSRHFLTNILWIHLGIIFFCALIMISILNFLASTSSVKLDTLIVLSNLLTVNAVFSAILITYLFTRVTWQKERKSKIYREAEKISMKITEFRRILKKLTENFGVWNNEKATKSLLDNGEFKHVTFYDFQMLRTSDYRPDKSIEEIIRKLYEHENYSEGNTTLYLAMASLVKNRKRRIFELQPELYKDFTIHGVYNIKYIEEWIDGGVFGTIWFWFNQNRDFFNYHALKNEKKDILSAAARINKKYKKYELDNKLFEELADDFNFYYLKELYLYLLELKRGITDLNILIVSLISISLIFGVLFPFTLILIKSNADWFFLSVAVLASINVGFISYFILRFPFLIKRELKWI